MEFDELMMLCGLREDSTLTRSRFRTDLRNELRQEITLRDEENYMIDHDIEDQEEVRNFVQVLRKILIQPSHEDPQRTSISLHMSKVHILTKSL
ncbi:unnamed protein product [Spirodela intermedia]|uniref:Uncharacterized protein n=1 Tax=Spirodela intermedia TaxID=51605 RepID=A0A7I8IHB6_SPIIN|nr:unnamed protein product [Spirodela intermedia]CAA6657114.1 unnamed protein product [Spirodela intermedia]